MHSVVSDIYDVQRNASDDALRITSRYEVGETFFVNAVSNPEPMHGGKPKVPVRAKEAPAEDKVLYQCLGDIPDSDVQAFVKACHLDYVGSNHHSNSIFIVPTSKALTAINKDIKDALGSIDEKSPEAVQTIKEKALLYKFFIIDMFGKVEKNAGFEYRLPTTYPDDFDEKIIYRRTTRYNEIAVFVQLTKKGLNVSMSKDMSNAVTCPFVNIIGRYPRYVSFVFKGDILPLLDAKSTKKCSPAKKTAKAQLKARLNSMEDEEIAASEFVADMIKTHGVEKCRPYYSANMVQAAFAMISAFGPTSNIQACGDKECKKMHGQMMKAYKPQMKSQCNKASLAKVVDFVDKFSGDDARYTSSAFFKAMTQSYARVGGAGSIHHLAGDVAYGIYDDTNNVDYAVDIMSKVKKYAESDVDDDFEYSLMRSAIANHPFQGFVAQQYYPMIETLDDEPVIKGGEPKEEKPDVEPETLLEFPPEEPKDVTDIEHML